MKSTEVGKRFPEGPIDGRLGEEHIIIWSRKGRGGVEGRGGEE